MRRIGVGIIGWGFMGKTHTHALRSIPLFYDNLDFEPRLVGVCSGNPQKAERAKEMMGFEFATGDYRELLACPDIEVVSICTPNGLHEEMAIAALQAGKHVYLDKPVAVDGPSADRIAQAARASGKLTQVVLNNRFMPSSMRAKEIVQQGGVGEVISFSAKFLHSGSIDPNKPIGWKQGMEGGVLLDLGSHALDLITWLIGYPQSVMCVTRNLYPSRPTKEGTRTADLTEDQALMTLRMPNGALGTVEASKIATGANDELTYEIYGTKGALKWSSMEPSWLNYYDNTLPEQPLGGSRGYTKIDCVARYPAPGGTFLPPKSAIGWDRAHIHCYYSFLSCVAHGGKPEPDIEEGARLQHLLDGMAQSARDGRWIDIEK